MPTDSKPWAAPSGLPSAHAVQSAMHVAHVIGSDRARVVDAHESYWRRAVGGTFSPPDLKAGEQLLISCGLVDLVGDELVANGELEHLIQSDPSEVSAVLCLRAVDPSQMHEAPGDEFAQELAILVPDEERRDRVFRSLARLFDDTVLKTVGNIGEELVLESARRDLVTLGQARLAEGVKRVSLYDDTAGYDICAPCTDGTDRLLEVKATVVDVDPVGVHLSRNEADTALRRRNWSIVVCVIDSVEDRTGEIIGWMPGSPLARFFPADSKDGRWEVAKLWIPRVLLVPGIPSAVP